MFAEERRQKILTLLDREGRVTVAELVELLGVSTDTIRRDLKNLEALGLLQRTHGGAIQPHWAQKTGNLGDEEQAVDAAKKRICEAAVRLVQPGETIFIEGSTTTLPMTEYLPRGVPLTILTNGWEIASRLRGQDGVALIAVGGIMRSSGNTTGTLTIEQLKQFAVDRSFVSASGVDPERGVTTATPDTAYLKRTVAAISRQLIVLADHRKIGRVAFTTSIPSNQVDLLITDRQADEKILQQLRQLGVSVLVATG